MTVVAKILRLIQRPVGREKRWREVAIRVPAEVVKEMEERYGPLENVPMLVIASPDVVIAAPVQALGLEAAVVETLMRLRRLGLIVKQRVAETVAQAEA